MNSGSLNFKISAIIATLAIGSLLIVSIGLFKMSEIKSSLNVIVDSTATRVSLAKEIRALFYVQMLNERNYVLEDSTENKKKIDDLMSRRNDEIHKRMEQYSDLATEEGRRNLQEFKDTYKAWWVISAQVRDLSFKHSDKEAYALASKEGSPLKKKAEDIIISITERNEKWMTQAVHDTDEQYKQARLIMICASLLSILIGISIGAVVLRRLSRMINRVIENLNDNASQVSQAAQQIASASVELSEATTEQASSLEETVATLEELTSMVKVNADNTSQAALLSQEANHTATRGQHSMSGLLKSMTEVSADSKRIEEIISVIDSIAFQTNLLALNAAVEAARAGEQGKGFAVVAEAVRNLAQKSAEAAKDINSLIKSSVEKIERSNNQAIESGEVLKQILNAIQKIQDLNKEIASASEEQSNGLSQISKAMNQLDQTTQVNAASSEEAAASAEELSAQADTLTRVVETLTITIHGVKTPKPHSSFAAPVRTASQTA